MKKYRLSGMLAVGGLSVLLAFCGGCALEELENCTESVNQKKQETKAPEAKTEVEGPEFFAEVGADIEAPAGAENARYFLVSKRIAEILFTRNEVQYSYRASQLEEDLTGIRDAQALEGVQATVGRLAIPIQAIQDGYLAVWKWGGISYSLTADSQAGGEIVKSLVEELARETMPAQI